MKVLPLTYAKQKFATKEEDRRDKPEKRTLSVVGAVSPFTTGIRYFATIPSCTMGHGADFS